MTVDKGRISVDQLAGPKKKTSIVPWVIALALVLGAAGLIWVYWGEGEIPLPVKTGQDAAPAKAADGEKPADAKALKTTDGAPAPPPKTGDKVVQVPLPGQAAGANPQAVVSGQVPAGKKGAAQSPGAAQKPAPAAGAVAKGKMPASGDVQASRKRPYGLEESLDAVVRSDEKIKVGDKVIPVTELQRKLMVQQRGQVMESSLGKPEKISVWGVHVVRPGESLWSIHFRLLREYMAARGVKLGAKADQPTTEGYSSGVGKVLKFAEHMVGVYNTQTRHMSRNLNMLEPGHKVVVYNLTEIFAQLAKINPRDLSGVMYDGRVLFFPESPKKD